MMIIFHRIRLWLATKEGSKKIVMMKMIQRWLLRGIAALKSGVRKGSRKIIASSMKNFSKVGSQGPETNSSPIQTPKTSLMPSHYM